MAARQRANGQRESLSGEVRGARAPKRRGAEKRGEGDRVGVRPVIKDPDVKRAFVLIDWLKVLAGAVHTRGDEKSRAEIRRLWGAFKRLESETAQRAWLLRWLRTTGLSVRALGRQSAADSEVDLIVKMYANDVPHHAELIEQHRGLVRAAIDAYARSKGGRKKKAQPKSTPVPNAEGAIKALCIAMGWAADWPSLKKSMQRSRRPRTKS